MVQEKADSCLAGFSQTYDKNMPVLQLKVFVRFCHHLCHVFAGIALVI